MIFDHKNPDYLGVFLERADRLERIRANPSVVPAMKLHYRDNPVAFINDWGCTFDPRNIEVGLPAIIPFILFERQEEWVHWVIEKWRNREPGVSPKSREVGVSWLVMSLSCSLSLHNDNFSVGIGSRKEEYVDKLGDMKSLFAKGRMFMRLLPNEFRGGWNEGTDAPHMLMKFPDSGSTIAGEAGSNIGRGNRTGIYFVDEAQPLTAKILTPSGWKTMGDMEIGSVVSTPDGGRSSVIGINDCGVQQLYRITFSDGESVEASENHLWDTQHVIGRRSSETLRTRELLNDYRYDSPGGQVQYRYRVPLTDPIQFTGSQNKLALHPYIVGAMLGDGIYSGSGTPRFCSADDEIPAMISTLLPNGVKLGKPSYKPVGPCAGYCLINAEEGRGRQHGGAYNTSTMRDLLNHVGLEAKTAPYKFVPEVYKFAHIEDRLALLQGLMDTDGSCGSSGYACYVTTSERLAEDVAFLVRSLGGMCRVKKRSDPRGYRDGYKLGITLPAGMNPFRLRRKLENYANRKGRDQSRAIVNIEKIDSRPARCISIAAKNGLYITDNFTVTHNSAFLERPELVDAALSNTTNCRIDVSSANGMANPFAQKVHAAAYVNKNRVFVIHWRDDPRKDEAWYAKKVEELNNPVIVAQELDINYSASAEGVLIPSDWIAASIDADKKLGFEPSGMHSAALDVADEGQDTLSWCSAHGVCVTDIVEWSGKGGDLHRSTDKAFSLCMAAGISDLVYDADGLGAGIRGAARVLNESLRASGQDGIQVSAFRGSAAVERPEAQDIKGRKNKDYFANCKAQSWWALRMRFYMTYLAVIEGRDDIDLDDIISIPSTLRLKTKLMLELVQPTYSVGNSGKLQVDKTPDGAKSPNLADSLMIRFNRNRKPMQINGAAIERAITPRPLAAHGARRGLGISQAALQRFSVSRR